MSELSEALEKLDIKLEATHLGLRSKKEKVRHEYQDKMVEKEWWYDEWHIKLTMNGKVWEPEGTYKTGLGNRKLNQNVKREDLYGEKYYVGKYVDKMVIGLHNLAAEGFAKVVKPTLADVLGSYLLNASSANETFENWCSTFSYDTDSRKALEIYLVCQKIRDELIRFLGYELFDRLSKLEH